MRCAGRAQQQRLAGSAAAQGDRQAGWRAWAVAGTSCCPCIDPSWPWSRGFRDRAPAGSCVGVAGVHLDPVVVGGTAVVTASGRGRPGRRRAARWGSVSTGSAEELAGARSAEGAAAETAADSAGGCANVQVLQMRRRTASCVRTRLQRSLVSSARKTFVKRRLLPPLQLAALAFISCPCAARPRSSLCRTTPYSYAVLRALTI